MFDITRTDGRSQRSIIMDLFSGRATGDVITYSEIQAALGTLDRRAAQSAVNAAKRGLLVERAIAVDAVENEGYRIAAPAEHLTLARRHQKRSNRSLLRGRNTTNHVDVRGLTEDQRAALVQAGRALDYLLREQRRLNIRQANLERSLSSVVERQERSEGETRELQDRMARIEARIQGTAQ